MSGSCSEELTSFDFDGVRANHEVRAEGAAAHA
jgi:hypothetical protein